MPYPFQPMTFTPPQFNTAEMVRIAAQKTNQAGRNSQFPQSTLQNNTPTSVPLTAHWAQTAVQEMNRDIIRNSQFPRGTLQNNTPTSVPLTSVRGTSPSREGTWQSSNNDSATYRRLAGTPDPIAFNPTFASSSLAALEAAGNLNSRCLEASPSRRVVPDRTVESPSKLEMLRQLKRKLNKVLSEVNDNISEEEGRESNIQLPGPLTMTQIAASSAQLAPVQAARQTTQVAATCVHPAPADAGRQMTQGTTARVQPTDVPSVAEMFSEFANDFSEDEGGESDVQNPSAQPQNIRNPGSLTATSVLAATRVHPGAVMAALIPARQSAKSKAKTSKKTKLEVGEFVCAICHGDFASDHSLKRHSVVHTGKKPYKCTECERKFTQSQSLTRHLLDIHNIKVAKKTKKASAP